MDKYIVHVFKAFTYQNIIYNKGSSFYADAAMVKDLERLGLLKNVTQETVVQEKKTRVRRRPRANAKKN